MTVDACWILFVNAGMNCDCEVVRAEHRQAFCVVWVGRAWRQFEIFVLADVDTLARVAVLKFQSQIFLNTFYTFCKFYLFLSSPEQWKKWKTLMERTWKQQRLNSKRKRSTSFHEQFLSTDDQLERARQVESLDGFSTLVSKHYTKPELSRSMLEMTRNREQKAESRHKSFKVDHKNLFL